MTDSDTFAARAAELRSRTEDLSTRIARQSKALEAAGGQAAAVSATAVSPENSVRVTVDATGLLTELVIAPEVMTRTSAAELARRITETTRAAAIQARERVRALYAGLVDEGVIRTVPDLLPRVPAPAQAPPAPRPSRPVWDEPEETPSFQRDAW
ncbi:hypothetical protein JOF41_001521 [Saccharothrix coeruleofusca]|uniref:YbaB/EbfC family nucleoid-associated protein n=1 Tax=Saccharothrix coeruleofusca TaxID=33919 RepID=UPI001AE8BE44|nr:YbaB/EbfC family nucleoid-associated protein [Saccharothrix coeruleofusca]MBP2335343.1 hypothetical protein [Saccharothrix coeruleofusca]